MRKIIVAFALFAVIAEVNTVAEASVWQSIKNVGSKTAGAIKSTGTALINTGKSTKNVLNRYVGSTISDRLHGRGSSNDTSSLQNITYYIKQFKNNIASSASSQMQYINKQFPTTSEDLSILVAYYCFAKNCELLLSVLEPILSKIRTDQATLLGNSDVTQSAENTLQNSLQLLLSNGLKSAETILQTSAIALLQIIQRASENGEVPQTNIATLYNQVNALMSNQLFGLIVSLTTNIDNIQGSQGNTKRIESLVKNILLIQKVLTILQGYINGGNVIGQIENTLQSCEYYSGTGKEYYAENSQALIPYQNPYETAYSEEGKEDEEDEEEQRSS